MKSIIVVLVCLVALSSACTCGGSYKSDRWKSPEVENRYKSTVRIMVDCGDQEIFPGFVMPVAWWGSGVVSGPHTIYTAKHVGNCNLNWKSDGVLPRKVEIVFWNGDRKPAHVVALAKGDADGARLYIDEEQANWVPLSDRKLRVGDKACYTGGSYPYDHLITKCGEINKIEKDGVFWTDIHGVPGNSGGPIFDEGGKVIGLLTHGYTRSAELISGAVPYTKLP